LRVETLVLASKVQTLALRVETLVLASKVQTSALRVETLALRAEALALRFGLDYITVICIQTRLPWRNGRKTSSLLYLLLALETAAASHSGNIPSQMKATYVTSGVRKGMRLKLLSHS